MKIVNFFGEAIYGLLYIGILLKFYRRCVVQSVSITRRSIIELQFYLKIGNKKEVKSITMIKTFLKCFEIANCGVFMNRQKIS